MVTFFLAIVVKFKATAVCFYVNPVIGWLVTMLMKLYGNLAVSSDFYVVFVVLALLVLEIKTVILVMFIGTAITKEAEGHYLLRLVANVLDLITPW